MLLNVRLFCSLLYFTTTTTTTTTIDAIKERLEVLGVGNGEGELVDHHLKLKALPEVDLPALQPQPALLFRQHPACLQAQALHGGGQPLQTAVHHRPDARIGHLQVGRLAAQSPVHRDHALGDLDETAVEHPLGGDQRLRELKLRPAGEQAAQHAQRQFAHLREESARPLGLQLKETQLEAVAEGKVVGNAGEQQQFRLLNHHAHFHRLCFPAATWRRPVSLPADPASSSWTWMTAVSWKRLAMAKASLSTAQEQLQKVTIKKKVIIENAFAGSMNSLLYYIYTGTVDNKDKLTVEFFSAADKVSRAQHDCRVTRTVTPVVNTGGRIYLHRPPVIIAASGLSAATPPPQNPRPSTSSEFVERSPCDVLL
ncbi:hypothetical protein TYRP_023101 [Tyrophagus putrescentiae]|nr:hypothetical protein TYRP_023101 [Tyrophagus putrescentiae]